MMAPKKARKDSSSLNDLRAKAAAEFMDIHAQPNHLVQYMNKLVEDHADEAEHFLLKATLRVRRRLLCELANTGPEQAALRRFQRQWNSTFRAESELDLVELREQLRFIWRRPAINRAERVLNEWLAGRPSPAGTRALPYGCSLGAGRLVPDWKDMRAMLTQGVLENWRNFSFCTNTDCATPYYIARRKDQVVCDAEICKAEKQRAHALKWWHENRGTKGG
jgi:hypothetical protein